MSEKRRNWSREELIVAFNLYCKIEFSKINYRNPLLIKLADAIGRTPSAVAWKLVNFASLDPTLHDRGIKGASNIGKMDKVIFNEFTDNWDALIYESELLLAKYFNQEIKLNEDIKNLIQKKGVEEERMVKVRINQSFFRKMILSAYNSTCCITGITHRELLVASHIIPWSENEKNRLNPQNGLCLNNLHDKAFDRGLISFDSQYRLILSSELKQNNNANMVHYFKNLEGQQLKLPRRFLPDKYFLEYHYENIFRK